MAVYNEILDWASNKPAFVQDALRRIITNATISQNDIDELALLLKKENGDTTVTLNPIAINRSHIPINITAGTVYPKLISIRNPINICALDNQAQLVFSNNGLTVVYGNNGSGKSSYARILKKLCWSRISNIQLKKNVFTPTNSMQQVELTIEVNGTTHNFQWTDGTPSNSDLSSIFVFDTECGDIYVNNENPTEYKPIGIDVLERLIPVLNSVSHKLGSEVEGYNSQKPILDPSLDTTITGQWYAQLESKTRVEIDTYIQFSQTNSDRKRELFTLINAQNPQQNIQHLSSFKGRIGNYVQQFVRVEERFREDAVEEILTLRSRYENIKAAYDVASGELTGLNSIEGFGTSPWRTLWNAAKNFALNNGMSDGQNFPSEGSLEKCVLCQQKLDESAQQRLLGFNRFVLNDVSTQLSSIENEIQQKTNQYSSIVVPPIQNFTELNQHITSFENDYDLFVRSLNTIKSAVINFLHNGGELNIHLNDISASINALFPNIETQIEQNIQLKDNRNALIVEYNELTAKEFLFNNKAGILQYFDENKWKSWITLCQSQIITNIISRKIGELVENHAVAIQHQEFINHLHYFNPELSTKVLLSKTRTTQGNTFQKCSLNGITDDINSVLSEGEKKIIALSNFLAECTIDNKKYSIIFDDPVNSLDMEYRELIAKKIVELSQDRQIIILTHDLSFLRLLIDTHKLTINTDCRVIGIDKYNGISGVVTDEIPYLAKNVDERVDSIRRILREHDAMHLSDAHGRETKLDSARKRFRFLLERSVEEILTNKTYERFSKNIHFKKGNLSSFIVVEQADIDFLLGLFSKYSVTEHDGGTSTIPLLPNKDAIEQDIRDYMDWKNTFKDKHRTFLQTYN